MLNVASSIILCHNDVGTWPMCLDTGGTRDEKGWELFIPISPFSCSNAGAPNWTRLSRLGIGVGKLGATGLPWGLAHSTLWLGPLLPLYIQMGSNTRAQQAMILFVLVFIDMGRVYGIAIDPEEGQLYFANCDRHRVDIVNLDNKQRDTFSTDQWPIGIVLDLINRYEYMLGNRT